MRISSTPISASVQLTGAKPGPTKHIALFLAAIAFCSVAAAQTAGTYQVTNVISDGSVPATTMDANFINPWGVTPTATFWINTQATGFSYVVANRRHHLIQSLHPRSHRRHHRHRQTHRRSLHRLCPYRLHPPQRHQGQLPLRLARRHHLRLEQQARHRRAAVAQVVINNNSAAPSTPTWAS